MIPTWQRTCTMDISDKCTLECPTCLRQGYRKRGEVIPGGDLTPERFEKLIHYFKGFSFCGQISDPIFNPHLAELLKMCKDNHKSISVHTAASHRKKEWWNEVFEANTNARWMFGIDGLPYESFLHRKNQDGEHLFNMMLLAKSKGIKVTWQYIVFSYNEDHIEEATELALKHDLVLRIMASARWNDTKKRRDPMRPKNKKWWIVRPWESREGKDD